MIICTLSVSSSYPISIITTYQRSTNLLTGSIIPLKLHCQRFSMINEHLLIRKGRILVLSDLSLAFNTVDHEMLLKQLKYRIGLRDMAYDWVESYLSGRHKFVSVAGSKSCTQKLVLGVSVRTGDISHLHHPPRQHSVKA